LVKQALHNPPHSPHSQDLYRPLIPQQRHHQPLLLLHQAYAAEPSADSHQTAAASTDLNPAAAAEPVFLVPEWQVENLVVCSAAAAPLPAAPAAAAAAALVVRALTAAVGSQAAQALPLYPPASVCQCHQHPATYLTLLPVLLLLR
jgi:hypothetical protein